MSAPPRLSGTLNDRRDLQRASAGADAPADAVTIYLPDEPLVLPDPLLDGALPR
ncbi:MAG: hypothetical protein JWM77_1900 [Rhodospirillales bacterium]|nr:hypothetical protein [Rhodospirillales bacterium]